MMTMSGIECLLDRHKVAISQDLVARKSPSECKPCRPPGKTYACFPSLGRDI